MFKIGDKVKCVDGQEVNGLYEDDVYTISGTNLNHPLGRLVKIEGLPVQFFADRFELVERIPEGVIPEEVIPEGVIAEGVILEESFAGEGKPALENIHAHITVAADNFTTTYKGKLSKDQFDQIMEVLYGEQF